MKEFRPSPKLLIPLIIIGILAIVALSTQKPENAPAKKIDVAILPTVPFENFTPPTPPEPPKPVPKVFEYIEVTESCNSGYGGDACVNIRSGAGTSFPAVMKVRNGMVLHVNGTIEADGHTWYRIVFDDWLRYPERVSGNWYIAGDYVRHFTTDGPSEIPQNTKTDTTKRILVDRSEQMLYAYEGDSLFMQQKISTGLDGTPTPRGTFYVYRKTPSRYMQGPLPGISDQYYDLPGVPWNMYFTEGGAVIHGAYWHNNFGQPWSHGCVNLPPEKARELYDWGVLGMQVTIQD